MLEGKRIVITRAADQAEPMHSMLKSLGADVVLFPVLSVVAADDWTLVDKALAGLSGYNALIFTSVNGVRHFVDRAAKTAPKFTETLKGRKVYAVGAETSAALGKAGIEGITFPQATNAEQLMESIVDNSDAQKFLFVHGNLTDSSTADPLLQDGRTVDEIVVYKTVEKKPDDSGEMAAAIKDQTVDMLTFFSPSAVKAFASIVGDPAMKLPCAVIGGTTACSAENAGFENVIKPAFPSTDSLLNAIINYFSQSSGAGT